MKKTVISQNRVSRQQKENPHERLSFKEKIRNSKSIIHSKYALIIEVEKGYAKIIEPTHL